MQWAETDNPLWGQTLNPRNPNFIPGGSTGGEGSILALHGSILGLGTDIGGSIRIPGSMNGLYAFKPTVSFDFLAFPFLSFSILQCHIIVIVLTFAE